HMGEGDRTVDLVHDQLTFWTSRWFLIEGEKLRELSIPPTASVVDAFRGRLVLWLKEDWAVHGSKFSAGTVVHAQLVALQVDAGSIDPVVWSEPSVVVKGVSVGPQDILVSPLDNVRGRLYRY